MRQSNEQELRLARQIQRASLPKEVPELGGWQISPSTSLLEVGGDSYDFHLLPESKLGVVIGDATGKGVPAALVMSTTCGMLQLAAQALDSSLAWGGTLQGQRDVAGSHPCQHVRHLLLRHP